MRIFPVFYASTYYFWVTVRLLLTIAGLISAFSMSGEPMNRLESNINLISTIYLIVMAINSIRELTGNRKRNALNYFTGAFSVLIGLTLAWLIFWIGPAQLTVSPPIVLLFGTLCILLGLFDLNSPSPKDPEE